MSIRVIKPGLLTTVQDWGRIGSQSIGFNVSGVMDRRSYRLANFLVGNYTDEAVLEMTALGGSFVFLESNYIAITGADMGATIEGVPAPMYQTIFVREGDTLSFTAAKSGMYTYVAFAGGLDVPQVLGSRSTNLKCSIGGFDGLYGIGISLYFRPCNLSNKFLKIYLYFNLNRFNNSNMFILNHFPLQ